MSVLINDMEKPKSCYAVIDGEAEYCPFVNTDDDCVLLLKKGKCEGTWEEQYSKCPLVETSEPCEDAVSRADVVDMLEMYPFTEYSEYEAAREAVKRLSPVTPERETGEWGEHGECPFCGYLQQWDDDKFCGNCGARMDGGDSHEDN